MQSTSLSAFRYSEVCPTDAITHGHGFELAMLNATTLVMRKEDMLIPVASLTAVR